MSRMGKLSTRALLSRSLKLLPPACAIAAVIALGGTAWSQEGQKNDEVFSLSALIGLNNTGLGNLSGHPHTFFSFDISWFDPVIGKFYLADRSNKSLDIFDPTTGTFTQVVNTGFQGFTGSNDTSGPDGVLTANNHTEVWVGDTGGTCFMPPPGTSCGPGQVWVLNTNGSVKTLPGSPPIANPISVGGASRADELCYDSKDHLIMIASPAESPPYVTFISTAGTNAYKVVGTLLFDGTNAPNATNGIEQCGWSPATGLFYQNVPAVNSKNPGEDDVPGAIAVINPKSVLSGTPKVEKSFTIPLADCAGPQGMAIGPSNQVLEGCNAASPDGHRNIVIVNIRNGNVLSVIPDLGGADEVWFNPGDGHYFVPSCNTDCRTVGQGLNGKEVLGVIDSAGRKLDHSVLVAVQNSDAIIIPNSNPRTIHSVAAASNTNQVFLPIPAVGGTAPQFAPTLCDDKVTVIGTGTPSSANGCIAILSPSGRNDNPRTVQERGPDDRQN